MVDANGRDSRIMNRPANQLGYYREPLERVEMDRGFAERLKRGRREPRIDLRKRLGTGTRRLEDSRARHYREKLVDARPWNGPSDTTFSQFGNARGRALMPFVIAPVCVDQDIGIDRDHRN